MVRRCPAGMLSATGSRPGPAGHRRRQLLLLVTSSVAPVTTSVALVTSTGQIGSLALGVSPVIHRWKLTKMMASARPGDYRRTGVPGG